MKQPTTSNTMPLPVSRLVLVSALLATVAVGQCSNPWATNLSLPSPAFIYSTTMWDPDGSGPQPEQLVVGGNFGPNGTTPYNGIATWDAIGSAWLPVGNWNGVQVLAVAGGVNGELFASEFVSATAGYRVMEWDGATWSQLGGAFSHQVVAAVVLPNGDLVVAGGFSQVGATAAATVARWDGSAWHAMGSGLGNYYCDELLVMPNGDLVAGGFFGVARWDGAAWNTLDTLTTWALALAAAPNGDLVAGFNYNVVRRWDGTSWTQVGSAVLPSTISYIEALVVLPNGDLIAGQGYVGAGGTDNLARWDGTSWSLLGPTTGAVRKLLVRPGPDLDVIAVGNFLSVNGLASNAIARLTTTCPASITTIASGCTTTTVGFTAQPAWVGALWQATVTSVPTTAFVVAAYGVTPAATPLATLLPQSILGCILHVQPGVLELLPTSNGVAEANWTLPNTAALGGAQFRCQAIVLQPGVAAPIVSAFASDAVELTIGVF